MEVKYLDLKSHFESLNIESVLNGVFTSCQFVLGPQLDEFEKSFAELCGVKYAVGVDNGTNALFLALKALDIGPGDEVITVPNSFWGVST